MLTQAIIPTLSPVSDATTSQAIHSSLPESHLILTSSGAKVVARARNLDVGHEDLPVLVMIHGYPQSMNMFRYMVPLLPGELPLFVPDIPGYGESTKSSPPFDTQAYSKRSIGNDILEALKKALGARSKPSKIIFLGHDRGARICHRLAVDYGEGLIPKGDFELLGVVLLDIVLTAVQFASLADPKVAVATFHWPFLAAPPPLPESMIAALGGDIWVETNIKKWTGASVTSQAQMSFGMDVYRTYFKKDSVIAASCADYRAGALIDAPQQEEDQNEGRKIQCPTLVLYSEIYLGSRYDVGKVWNDWVEGGKGVEGRLETRAVGNGVGHFLCEEAPEEIVDGAMGWIRGVLGVNV